MPATEKRLSFSKIFLRLFPSVEIKKSEGDNPESSWLNIFKSYRELVSENTSLKLETLKREGYAKANSRLEEKLRARERHITNLQKNLNEANKFRGLEKQLSEAQKVIEDIGTESALAWEQMSRINRDSQAISAYRTLRYISI